MKLVVQGRGTCEKECSTKTIKAQFKTNYICPPLTQRTWHLRESGGQHCIVAHPGGSNLQLAAEPVNFHKIHRCPWDFNSFPLTW